VPVAVNCLVRPAGTLGLAGVTAMELKVTGVTGLAGSQCSFPPSLQPVMKTATSNAINHVWEYFLFLNIMSPPLFSISFSFPSFNEGKTLFPT
jgi:hypothetical protein